MSNAENLHAEQAADLAALESMAGEGEQQAGELVEQQAPGLEEELGDLLGLGVVTLGAMYPSVPKNCPPEAVKMLAAVWAGVGEKYGWSSVMGGQYGKEMAAAFVSFPVVIAVYKGIKADIAASQPAQPVAAPGELEFKAPMVAGNPGAKTVSVGAAI